MAVSKPGSSAGSRAGSRGSLALVLILTALLLPAPAGAQEAKQKSTSRSRSQRLGPTAQTQGSRGQKAGDQVLLYRFRLDTDSMGSELIVTNSSDSAGTFTLFAQEAEGGISKEIKRTIEAGAVFAISAAEAGWSPDNVVSIKASQRLVLSLQFPGEEKATEIVRDPTVGVYEVFGMGRQSEFAPSAKRRALSLLYSDRRFSRDLAPETTPQQGTSELLETSGRSPVHGLFVLQSN